MDQRDIGSQREAFGADEADEYTNVAIPSLGVDWKVLYTSLRRALWAWVSCATDERKRSSQEAGMADPNRT